MNKSELIISVSDQTGLSRRDAEKAVTAALDIITAALAQNEKVQLTGFGTFETRHHEARPGRNPKTMETIEIPAGRAPVFKAGKALRDAVAE